MIKHDIQDVRFLKSVKDIHADGNDARVDRFYQAPGKRYVCWEESGWVHFKARREIKVPRTSILEMEPMTDAKRKELGPCTIEYPTEPMVKTDGKGSAK